MKKTLLALFAGLLGGALTTAAQQPAASAPATTPSAFESDPAGWIDLLPNAALDGWKRIPSPGKALFETNPWSRREGEDVLHCARLPMKSEEFLCEREFGDGVFHVEWRFAPVEKGKGYNSGVYVRSSPDGTVWHQAQVGNGNVGYLFGPTLKDGKVEQFKVDDQVPQRGKPPGEWNTFEVTCKGKDITLWVNGAVTATWHDCEVPRGLVGLEAEGWEIEFRNVKFKEINPH